MARKDLNDCKFTGNLGADPETKTLPGGALVSKFRIACNRTYTKDGATVEETEWIQAIAWNKLAEIVDKYLRKGSRVLISGRLKTRSWDKDDGTKGYATEIIVEDMLMLDPPKRDGDNEYNQESGYPEAEAPRSAPRAQASNGAPRRQTATAGAPRRPAGPPPEDDDLPF